jgi:hypothetical protein
MPQTIEPVHVRANQPVSQAPASVASVTPRPAPAPAQSALPETIHKLSSKSETAASSKKSAAQPSSGVGLAIFATVVIVVSLAGLAVLAYIKTKK